MKPRSKTPVAPHPELPVIWSADAEVALFTNILMKGGHKPAGRHKHFQVQTERSTSKLSHKMY